MRGGKRVSAGGARCAVVLFFFGWKHEKIILLHASSVLVFYTFGQDVVYSKLTLIVTLL